MIMHTGLLSERRKQQEAAITLEFEQSWRNLQTAICFLLSFILLLLQTIFTFTHAVIGMCSYFTTLSLAWVSSRQVMLAYSIATIEQQGEQNDGTARADH